MAKIWDTLGAAAVRVGLAEVTSDKAPTPVPSGDAPRLTPASGSGTTRGANVVAVPAIDPQTDNRIRGMLITAMQNDGAPLVEDVADILETLIDSIPDEALRYAAALKLLGKKGKFVDVILSDYDKCLGVLLQNKQAFEADTRAKLNEKVGSKQRAVEQLKSQIDQKRAQITAIEQEIATLETQRDQEQAGISVEASKIEQVQSRFEVIWGSINADITGQRTKIVQYGKGS